MMFESLSERLQKVVSNIKSKGVINEENISEITREIRLCLLEADVNIKIVREFIDKVKEKALGEEVRKSIKPGDMFVKILKDELVELLGGDSSPLEVSKNPTIVMVVGLQGGGKTTTVGKIGNMVRKKHHKKPLFVACDVYRPAAIDQLKSIGKQLNIEVYDEGKSNPVEIAKNALEFAKENGYDYILFDTAGRLQIDEVLMDELVNIENIIKPHEELLVIDAMMGQDAINVITGFNEKLNLTGCVLTKMDGDTKGGVALSLRHLTNIPIKLVGDSEKLDGIGEFYPDRVANRILGMGDLLSIIEKTEAELDTDEMMSTAKRMQKGKFDLEDFLKTTKQIKKLGPLENLIKLIPGASKMGLNKVEIDPKIMARTEAIILSMTPLERRNPDIIKASRKQRIAKGCGQKVEDVNRLLKQFDQMKMMMKQMNSGKFGNFKF
ncbi:MAG: signal recognition particle protein [bacterium]|nr:signal recognition particle protein [bacterium]